MGWGLAIGVGSALVGGLLGSRGASKAADTSADASRYAADLQQQQYQQTREDFAPWRETGEGALNVLARTYGLDGGDPNFDEFFASPDYNFRREEGERGLNRMASGRGMMLSGPRLKAGMRFNSNIAAGEYGDWYNRLAGLSGTGQTATASTGQAGAYATNAAGRAFQNAGDAKASGYLGQANAWGGAVNSLADILMQKYG